MGALKEAMVSAAVAVGANERTARNVAGNVVQCIDDHVRNSNVAHARCGLVTMTDEQCNAMVRALYDMAEALAAMRRDNNDREAAK